MNPAHLTLAIVALMGCAFLTKRIPHFITALTGSLVLAVLGLVPMKTLFAGFSNSTLILFAGMFVIGEAMFRTGLADAAGVWAVRKLGKGERRLLWGSMTAAGLLSTVASNTGTAAALLPVLIGICGAAGLPVSRQLMPMAFATGFGGFSALIGTPPNMIISEALARAGFRPFGFFEFAWVGIPLAIAGMAYMDWASRWLPKGKALPDVDSVPTETKVSKAPSADPVEYRRTRFRMATSAFILLAVVIVMASGWHGVSLEVIAVTGAILCVATGCLTGKQAIDGIEWETLILFGSMFAVAQALETSGAAKLIADGMALILGEQPGAWAMIALPIGVTMLLGTLLSNTACAVIMAPIGLDLAAKTGADPRAVLMAVALAASCSFLTPVGTPPNMLVWGPGGYRFSDFMKVGAGLSFVCLVIGVLIIPIVWPVFGR